MWSGVILVTGEKNFLIDSGADTSQKYIIPALNEMNMKIEDIDFLLNTHCHGDHIGGHYELVNQYGIRTAAYTGGAEYLLKPAENAVRIRTRFPNYSPKPQSWLKGVKADVLLEDGEILENRLKIIHTPGHDNDCVCWYDIPTKTIICGDSLQANGTPTQGIGFYQSLSDYRKSLQKLENEEIENIVCGHDYDGIGSVICGKENAMKSLAYCAARTETYDRLIRQYCAEGMQDPAQIAVRLIEEEGCGMPENLFLALYTVTEHLKRMGRK